LTVTQEDAGRTPGGAGAFAGLPRDELAAWGAVVMIVLAGFLGMWGYFDWEDSLPLPLLNPLAAKIMAFVLAFSGGALLSEKKRRTPDSRDADGAEDRWRS
jgi:hypothetical protein